MVTPVFSHSGGHGDLLKELTTKERYKRTKRKKER
jgi:hypothetical protein